MSDLVAKSRKEAIALGIRKFFTGKPCRNGHVAARRLPSGACLGCHNEHEKIRRAQPGYKEWMANYQRAWARSERGKLSAKVNAKRHYDKYPEKHRAVNARRRTLSRAFDAFTELDVWEIRKLQKNRCAHCRKKLVIWDVDHIFPISHGGTNHRRNIQLLCRKCNRRKSDWLPHEWAILNGRLL